MSFTGSIMIQKGFLDKDSFEKYIIDYFKPDRTIAKSRTENTWYRNFCLYNIGLCLDEKVEDDHYANRESFIIGQKFHFSQEIVIDFEKEALSKDQYIICIGFLGILKKRLTVICCSLRMLMMRYVFYMVRISYFPKERNTLKN